MNGQPKSPLRALAPIALVVFGIVFFIVVNSSLSGGEDSSLQTVDSGINEGKVNKVKTKEPIPTDATTETSTDPTTGTTGTELEPVNTDTTLTTTKTEYTVKPGDTLEAISAKTGIPVDELTTLNPEVDPQALVAGSTLKLTE